MAKIETQTHALRPRVGISACLLGDRVRYDGGHKRDPFLAESLGAVVEWVPVCPEVAIGLGVPRPAIHLVGSPGAPRLVVAGTGEDLTTRMRHFAARTARALEGLGLDGYVFKSRSPSCGLLRVPVTPGKRGRRLTGRGLYAATLLRRLPSLPVEEERALHDPETCRKFLERVFAGARGRRRRARRPGAGPTAWRSRPLTPSPEVRPARARRRPRPI